MVATGGKSGRLENGSNKPRQLPPSSTKQLSRKPWEEGRALIAGLEKALELQVDEVEVVSDSELLVKQMRGEYRVKNQALIDLSLEAARLGREIGRVTYTAVRRAENELADRLVNEALDAIA